MAKKRAANPTLKESRPGDAGAKPEWKVENIVATVAIDMNGAKIDLNQIARKYADCEYNPERFPGLVMRVPSPKATVLIFTTGKMVITGLRDAGEAGVITKDVIKKIKGAKIDITAEPVITIQNIVASGNLHVFVDLDKAAIVMDNAMYEPETFPGLVYRMAEPKAVFLIFSTGRIVCTGCKTKEIVGTAVTKLIGQIKELEVARVGLNHDGSENDDDLM
nr:TATA-box-binding protein [Candidatus Sigynarchaeota archaeon]